MDAENIDWGHFIQPDGTPHTKETMAAQAIEMFRKYRADAKPNLGYDGSSGQYNCYTDLLVAALES